MINLKNFNDVCEYFKGTIDSLINRYNLFDFKNDILIKLWNLSNKIDISRFESQKGLDNFIFISLKNYCITLYTKNFKYNETYVLCLDNENFHNILPSYFEDDFSNIIFEDLLKCLTKKEAMILNYKFKNNYSNEEIGNIINMSRNGVYRAVNRSLEKIRKILIYERNENID